MKLHGALRHHLLQISPVRTLYLRRKFSIERRLLAGQLASASSHPSIIHFSVNKSATQYVKRILRICAEENHITPVHMADYFFNINKTNFSEMSKEEFMNYSYVFKPNGFLYSVFGAMINGIEHLDEYLIVLVIRDPRDVLTSLYFSRAYSHSRPADPVRAAAYAERRRRVQSLSIDEFVFTEIDWIKGCYQGYIDGILGKPNVYITKYEKMIEDFPGWLDSLCEFCDLPINERTRRLLIQTAERSIPVGEDIHRHRRQVIPGDHKRKLKPETIAKLNQEFKPVFKAFNYEVE